jgi:hypothetical protein
MDTWIDTKTNKNCKHCENYNILSMYGCGIVDDNECKIHKISDQCSYTCCEDFLEVKK